MTESPTSELFLDVMRNVAASVTVVCATHNGIHHGLTVSAFCSVSLDPPLILVCIDKRSGSLPAIQAAGGFTVNFLSADSPDVAMHFASKREDKFSSVAHRAPDSPAAGPLLSEAAYAYFECKTVEVVDAGDHEIFVGRVGLGQRINAKSPLVYWDGAFPELVRPESSDDEQA